MILWQPVTTGRHFILIIRHHKTWVMFRWTKPDRSCKKLSKQDKLQKLRCSNTETFRSFQHCGEKHSHLEFCGYTPYLQTLKGWKISLQGNFHIVCTFRRTTITVVQRNLISISCCRSSSWWCYWSNPEGWKAFWQLWILNTCIKFIFLTKKTNPSTYDNNTLEHWFSNWGYRTSGGLRVGAWGSMKK